MSENGGYTIEKCPSCGAPLPIEADAQVCTYCKARVVRAGSHGGAEAHPSSPLVEAVRLQGGRMPAGWIELAFGYVPGDLCQKFSASFGAPLAALANQHINAAAHKLQVNYVHAASTQGAGVVFASMVKMVGRSNGVGRKGDVVMEVICQDAKTGGAALKALAPDEAHRPGRHW